MSGGSSGQGKGFASTLTVLGGSAASHCLEQRLQCQIALQAGLWDSWYHCQWQKQIYLLCTCPDQ